MSAHTGAVQIAVQLLAAIGQAVIATDLDGRVTYCNAAAETLYGWSSAELRGSMIKELIVPPLAQGQATAIMAAAHHEETWSGEFMVRRRDGQTFPALVTTTPIHDGSGAVTGFVGVSSDLSARKQAETDQAHLAAIVASSDDAIIGQTRDGIITSWNRSAEHLYGYTAEEMIGHSIQRLAPPERPDETPNLLARIVTGETVEHLETERLGKDGRRHAVSLTLSPIRDGGGRISGVSTIARDITERKHLEEARLQLAVQQAALQARTDADARFRSAFTQSGTGNMMVSLQGTFLEVNDTLCQLLGYPAAALMRLSMADITHPDDLEASRQLIEQALRETNALGPASQLEKRYLHKDGHLLWATTTLAMVRDALGVPLYFLVQIQDMSEQHQARDDLRASEERYHSLVDTSPDAILLADLNGTILVANPAAATLYGYAGPEDLQGVNTCALIAPQDQARLRANIRAALRDDGRAEALMYQQVRTDGRTFPTESHIAVMQDGATQPTALLVMVRDISARRQAEEALRDSEDRHRQMFQANQAIKILGDVATGLIVDANPAACAFYGYPLEVFRTKTIRDLNMLTTDQITIDMAAVNTGATPYFVRRHRLASGERRDIEVHSSIIKGRDSDLFYSIIHDITDRTRAEETVRRLANIVEVVSDAIMSVAVDGLITSWNPGAERLYGYPASEAVGQHVSLLAPHDHADEHLLLERTWRGDSITAFETVRRRKDGQLITVALSLSPILGPDGHIRGAASVSQDIGERKRFEDKLKHQALHDALTGLPNRVLLHDRLDQAIITGRRAATPMALLLLDLNRFKEINDTLGHQAGDALLQQVAARLQGTLRASDTVGRLGGDEFAILLPATDQTQAMLLADTIDTALRQPLVLEGRRIDIASSLGIALYPGHGDDAGTLLRHADVAMYTAKRDGIAYSVYVPENDLTSPARLTLVGDLRHAIDHDHLVLYYQPKVIMSTGRTAQVEALVRWRHPEHGLIPPGEFIELAEATGLIESLTLWVLNAALRQQAIWQAAGVDLGVAVNLSMRNLRDARLPETVAALLRRHNVAAAGVSFEITESAVMDDPDQAMAVLTRLHQLGVRIAVDDFGTGHSSLAYLDQLPIDEIKIDQSFVKGMTWNGTVIVRSVIDLARNLNLAVTAEGVETREDWDLLADMGCGMAQGYYLSRPLLPEEVVRWVTTSGKGVATERGSGRVILIVADNPVVHLLLTRAGYDVMTAADAAEALAAVEARTPHLIVIDVQRPGMSRLDLVQRLRSEAALRDTVIMALAGAPREEDKQYAMSIGCDVYAAKPRSHANLIRLIQSYLAA